MSQSNSELLRGLSHLSIALGEGVTQQWRQTRPSELNDYNGDPSSLSPATRTAVQETLRNAARMFGMELVEMKENEACRLDTGTDSILE